MIVSRKAALLIAAILGGAVLTPMRTQAQWWGHVPADFEECADAAEKAASREATKAALSQCNVKFAGRRKPGGGYSYFDFMQNRSFDIAGPNPTPEEQKHIDRQYTAFLDQERRNSIAAAFAAKRQQLQEATFRKETEKVPLPVGAPNKPQAVPTEARRMKPANCAEHSFSCDWPRLSDSINELKKALFGPPPGKAKRG